jgi:hypothetical protein
LPFIRPIVLSQSGRPADELQCIADARPDRRIILSALRHELCAVALNCAERVLCKLPLIRAASM